MVKCGIDNIPTTLVLEDHHVYTHTSFLALVNALLGDASVPGLFTHEELEGLLAPLRDAAAAEGGCVGGREGMFVCVMCVMCVVCDAAAAEGVCVCVCVFECVCLCTSVIMQ